MKFYKVTEMVETTPHLDNEPSFQVYRERIFDTRRKAEKYIKTCQQHCYVDCFLQGIEADFFEKKALPGRAALRRMNAGGL